MHTYTYIYGWREQFNIYMAHFAHCHLYRPLFPICSLHPYMYVYVCVLVLVLLPMLNQHSCACPQIASLTYAHRVYICIYMYLNLYLCRSYICICS